MLKIIDCQDCGEAEIEFGDYLPLKFWYQAKLNEPKLYWRSGNFKSTLIEVEIDRVTGKIIAVSLLLPGVVSRDFPVLNTPDDFMSCCCPIVNINEWPGDAINDEPSTLRVFVDSSRLLITLSESLETTRTISAGNIIFGVDANNYLIWMLIGKLPEDKLIELSNSWTSRH